MKFGIISDVHANVEALDAVLSDAGDITIIHIGDIVGYGPQPNEIVERLAQTRGVMGNHDAATIGKLDISEFNEKAQQSTLWTRKIITAENAQYLGTLPYKRIIDDDPSLPFLLVHGSPYQPHEFHYVFSLFEAEYAFKSFTQELAFIGHTHIPESYRVSHKIGETSQTAHGFGAKDILQLEAGFRYLVNVGSVGQPRDGDPAASYAILDTAARTVTWKRVPYDVAAVQAKIRATSLPTRNASRLANGE